MQGNSRKTKLRGFESLGEVPCIVGGIAKRSYGAAVGRVADDERDAALFTAIGRR